MIILFLLSQFNKTIFLVEGDGRKICVNGYETKSRLTNLGVKLNLQQVHKLAADILAAIVFGNSETANLDARITTEPLPIRKTILYLLPTAVRYLHTAHLVVQQTEICNYASIVLKEERIGNTLLKEAFCIFHQELVEVAVTAVKLCQFIIGSQSDYFHNLPAESNQFPGFFYTLHQPGAVVGTLLLTHIFHSLSSFHETLSIFTREYRCLFYRSCHCCNL